MEMGFRAFDPAAKPEVPKDLEAHNPPESLGQPVGLGDQVLHNYLKPHSQGLPCSSRGPKPETFSDQVIAPVVQKGAVAPRILTKALLSGTKSEPCCSGASAASTVSRPKPQDSPPYAKAT